MQETHVEKEYYSSPLETPDTVSVNDGENGRDLQIHDSSLDHKGRVPLRASTGSWKASFFIIAIEFSERLSYFGIAANMMTYMTTVIHQDLKTAANSVNIWTGVTTVTPLLGGFLADAYAGRYLMILLSALLYVLATYLVALATGGYKPCLESFGADQFDDNHSEERKQKVSFFNWWNVSLCAGLFLGTTLIVYLQDGVGWGSAFLTLSITMVVTVLVFILGRPIYRYRTPQGSPLTPMFQVLVAALVKRKLAVPSDPAFLHEVLKSEEKVQGRLLAHTNQLRFLDKAAVIEYENGVASAKKLSPWRLAPVTQVEELKLVLKMVPVWLTSLIFGIGIIQTSTFFVKQAKEMDRRVFNRFEIPPASIYTLTAIGMMTSVALYDRLLLPYLRRATGNERGINILKRMGIGMVFLIIAMVLSALVERQRLRAFHKGNVMSAFWLAPQFLIIGIGDGFSLVGMQEYFYDQVPDSMRSLGMAFYLSVIGVGSFLSSFLITVVDYVTGKNGGKKWIGKDVNHSRLDHFYWLLAAISVLNICIFALITKNYSYKKVENSVCVGDAPSNEGTKDRNRFLN
ncbi:hypothetical protein Cgig2_016350 [Carnegiea gigantea]|uniref:Uncharacterized protein n=1 Tax=Carnegiea gigantea TaxID=171969 RepID=A0A9Q1JVR4_9CARY|nr:hypothetical protein Cgig2_016350 [Carnegiea gigantea]